MLVADTQLLRNALGQFATGVCVITATPDGGKPFGMTINSFSSLSLDPPLVLWSLAHSSDTFSTFEMLDTYVVNVLSEDQQGLSNRYSRRNEHDLVDDDFYWSANNNPIIRGSLASFECEIFERYEGGDHVIMVGKVIDYKNDGDGKPLLFFSGQYQSLK